MNIQSKYLDIRPLDYTPLEDLYADYTIIYVLLSFNNDLLMLRHRE